MRKCILESTVSLMSIPGKIREMQMPAIVHLPDTVDVASQGLVGVWYSVASC